MHFSMHFSIHFSIHVFGGSKNNDSRYYRYLSVSTMFLLSPQVGPDGLGLLVCGFDASLDEDSVI